MSDPLFLDVDDVLLIHEEQLASAERRMDKPGLATEFRSLAAGVARP